MAQNGPTPTLKPLLPRIENQHFTTLQHRLDDRMRGVLGEPNLGLDLTTAYDMDRSALFNRIESLVGDTPLIHVGDVDGSSILAKVESQNPTENHYDRVFITTISRLEEDGIIQPGDELVEVTSGSGGRAFAWAARVLGYKARVIVPPELPEARLQDMRNFGAEIEVTEPGYMTKVSEAYVRRMEELEAQGYKVDKHKTPDYTVFTAEKDGERLCFVNHSANELTVEGFNGIGEEIHRQLPEDTKPGFVISVMGNGTSTTAISQSMRKYYPEIKVVGIEDQRSPRYFQEKHPGEYEKRFGRQPVFEQHDMYGSSAPDVRLKYGQTEIVDKAVDEIRLVDHEERDKVRNRYNQNRQDYEQIGNSSAASLVVANQLAIEHPGSTIVVIFYDKAGQYGEQPVIDRTPVFLGDRGRPQGVPPYGWHQRRVGSIALMPESIGQAYSRS